ADGERVVLTVEKTGPGLSPHLVSTVAEPFQRSPGRVRRGHAGVRHGLPVGRCGCRPRGGALTLARRGGGGRVATGGLPLVSGVEAMPTARGRAASGVASGAARGAEGRQMTTSSSSRN